MKQNSNYAKVYNQKSVKKSNLHLRDVNQVAMVTYPVRSKGNKRRYSIFEL